MAAGIILIPVAKQILGKAADLAVEQIGLLWNFKGELWKLKDTVSTIQAVLCDAEEKQFHNHQVKFWLEKLSDAMYDADDLLDDLATEARRKAIEEANEGRRTTPTASCWSVVCFLFSSLPKQLVYDLRMAHAIKAIREKLDVISKDKESFHLEVCAEEALPSRETDSCPPTIVVGREDDKKKIIRLLLNSYGEANISVVPIVGMGGLGKTTLSQLVFIDDGVKAHFDVKVWVYISQSFDVKIILGKMLQSICLESRADLPLENLQTRLQENIKGKRFLFVLDDVWEEDEIKWQSLGKYLTTGAPGSKVLVTTRSTKVAEVGGRTLKSGTNSIRIEPYYLKGLSEEESWNLLVKKALPREVPKDPQVYEVGKQILRKCDGVPLAVSTIATMLLDSKDPKTEWPSFLSKSFSTIAKDENRTMSALQLSFSHLPSHMKHCFAYCKLFPKGGKFNIQMLVKLWVAQGYIDSEDKGFDCFNTLWWRSFFHEVKFDEDGNMSTFAMHDLMHDLADLVAGEKIIISSSSSSLTNIPSKTLHLSVLSGGDDDDDDDPGKEADNAVLETTSKLRTLICGRPLSREKFEQVVQNFIRLRVLIIPGLASDANSEESSDWNASILLQSIGKLKHLRFLCFLETEMVKVPNSVTNLVNLQVLVLEGAFSVEELPCDIKKLVNLKHLIFDPTNMVYLTHMPKGVGELNLLQTLPIFVVGKRSSGSNDERIGAGLEELKKLNALHGKLIIKNLAEADSLDRGVYVLKEKLHLQSLVLDWSQDDENKDDFTLRSTHEEETLEMLYPHPNLKKLDICGGYRGRNLPNWLPTITNLVEFSLLDCRKCEYLPPVHQLLFLKKLTIKDCPQLKGIKNSGATEEEGEWPQFHCLDYVSIQFCPELNQMPTFPTVETLELVRVSLQPLEKTMKMRRGGSQVDDLGEHSCTTTYDEYHDTNNPLLSCPSPSSLVHPLSKLTDLYLEGFDDDLESLSDDSRSCLMSLQELRVFNCSRGVKLPSWLCSSASLTVIFLHSSETMEYLPPLHKLPSLRELSIYSCPKLKGCWWTKKKGNNSHKDGDDGHYFDYDPSMEGDDGEKEDHEEWPHFPCLSTLTISACPELTQMPLFPTLKGNLTLKGTSAQALVRTMKMKVVVEAALHEHHDSHEQHSTSTATISCPSSSSSSSSPRTALVTPLSNLTSLYLWKMDDLEFLPEEGLCNLTSLTELNIESCPRLVSLPTALRCLPCLKLLYINGCPQLRERCRKEDGEDWPKISNIPGIHVNGETIRWETQR